MYVSLSSSTVYAIGFVAFFLLTAGRGFEEPWMLPVFLVTMFMLPREARV
jgi:hypothetical protein